MKDIESRTWEDEEILRLLDEMAAGTPENPQLLAEGADEEVAELRRSCVEAVSCLPEALEPVAPPAGLRERILARVGPGARRSETAGFRPRQISAVESPRWLLPLAAALALMLVGVTGWQIWRVERQEETIARLSAELERAKVDAAELAAARELLAETRTRLEMVTAARAEYCALRAPSGGAYPQARGTLVMIRGRKDWFLKVEGLEPCKKGRQYKLWFMTDSGSTLGASFAVEGESDTVEIRAAGMPTGVKAVMITLEEHEVEAPSQPAVLYGDERMRIL